jgi:hypothetical protein
MKTQTTRQALDAALDASIAAHAEEGVSLLERLVAAPSVVGAAVGLEVLAVESRRWASRSSGPDPPPIPAAAAVPCSLARTRALQPRRPAGRHG